MPIQLKNEQQKKDPPRHNYTVTLIILILLLSLSACSFSLFPPIPEAEASTPRHIATEAEAPAVEAVAEARGPIPFAILYSALDIPHAIYEPAQGAYLGAWLAPGTTKPAFEEMSGKKHAVFAKEMFVGDDFPTTWMLQSIAAQAAPLIMLRLPGNAGEDFPLVELASFANELGNFNLPSFIVFNPLTPGHDMEPEDYVLLFRYARIMFRTYAPMAAFVWHSYDNLTTPDSPFYPGHDVVDWVSLEVLAPQTAEGFVRDVPAQLAPFYQSFQRHKPIILLPVGVGHFSRRDYVYRVPGAAVEIVRVYDAVRFAFPRVRLVVYGDHRISTPYGDDFSLTREYALLDAYREAIADDHFISRLAPAQEDGIAWMLSPLHGYFYEGQIFIDREIFTQANNRAFITREINGRTYVTAESVNWIKIATDHTRRVIYMHLGTGQN